MKRIPSALEIASRRTALSSRHWLLRGVFVAAIALIGAGTATSQGQPVNNLFANRIAIAGTNVVVYGTTVGATKETGEPYHGGDSGGASIWWSWQAPTNGFATISTAGSSFDTLLGVYAGSSVSALTIVAGDDDDPESSVLTSKVEFAAVANQIYQIAVDGYGGASGAVTLSVRLAPPTAPAWRLPDPTGPMVDSTNFAGKVVILDFWATWCVPCKAEMPDLVALQDKYRADGLVVLGADVSWSGENASTVLGFLAGFTPTVNYPVVMSDAATESQFGGINAIPTTFIIDRQNRIQKKYVGTQTFSTLEHQIIPLLYGNARIACQRTGNQMTLCWPTNTVVFTLQSATNLVSPAWSDWPTAPTVVNGAHTVPVPMTASPRYFRLRLTNY
jgi:thiol-disulfide isomerase/thioredoxin